MRGWQKRAFEVYQSLDPKPTSFRVIDPKDQLIAHTDHQPNHPVMKQAYDEFTQQNPRPPHAIESAFLSLEIVEAVLIPILEEIFRASETCILGICHTLEMASGRHHSAWTKGWETVGRGEVLQLHPQANQEIAKSWKSLRKALSSSLPLPATLPEYQTQYDKDELRLNRFEPKDLEYQQLYWLIVRALRLCDGRSVQLHQ